MNKHDFPRKFADLTPAQIAYLTGECHRSGACAEGMPLEDW